MSNAIRVHFIGGPLNGISRRLKFIEINFEIYKLYPTVKPEESYGIFKEWDVEKLGWVEVVSNYSIQQSYVDEQEILDRLFEKGRFKIAQTTTERGSILLPLTVKEKVEKIELLEDHEVTALRLSALSALPV